MVYANIFQRLKPYSAGIDFRRQCRRHILTSKVDPRTVRVKLFLLVADTKDRYSDESERPYKDDYDDVKLKKPFSLHGLYKHISADSGL